MKGRIEKTEEFVRKEMQNAEAGHAWWHVNRVRNNALHIARAEGNTDLEITELAALLHDVGDAKFNDGDEETGPETAGAFLKSLGMEDDKIGQIIYIMRYVSFRKKDDPKIVMNPELAAVMDADRLDAMGAIGIARAFHFGGFKNRPIYDPEIKPFESAGNHHYAPSINHFYEKLLLLKDLMQTLTGREMAEERHQVMLQYLEAFRKELFLEKLF